MNHESDHTVDAAKKELNADLLELFSVAAICTTRHFMPTRN